MKKLFNVGKKLIKNNAGFSLIELIIAVTILTIIVAAFTSAVYSMNNANRKNGIRKETRETFVGEIEEKMIASPTGTEDISVTYKVGASTETIDCWKIQGSGSGVMHSAVVEK